MPIVFICSLHVFFEDTPLVFFKETTLGGSYGSMQVGMHFSSMNIGSCGAECAGAHGMIR
jgi:hypothetical protein